MYSTIAQVAGALTNIVLDPIMIYGLFGCPEMGVRGAAYATVIGQIVSFLLALLFHLRIDKSISNKLCDWKPSGRLLREIYAIGFPAIVAQALLSGDDIWSEYHSGRYQRVHGNCIWPVL